MNEKSYQIILQEIHRIVCQSNVYSEELNRIYEITCAATQTTSSTQPPIFDNNLDAVAIAIRDGKPIPNWTRNE